MNIDINELYSILSKYIQEGIRDNFQYNCMDIFGDDEIQLTLENGEMINIYLNIETSEDDYKGGEE